MNLCNKNISGSVCLAGTSGFLPVRRLSGEAAHNDFLSFP